MEDDFGFIISTTNEIYENIWLGDLKAARNSARASIEKFGKRPDLSELESATAKMKAILKEARSEAREKEVKNRRLWVSERVSEEVRKTELDSTKSILGVLWIHLQSLAEAVDFLIKAETQRTLNDLGERNMAERQILRKGDRHRYSINRLPDGWEVRAIIDASVDAWDLKKLRSMLPESFLIEETLRKTPSDLVELYSRDMYLQILRQGRVVKITIHAPKAVEIENRIDNVVETIVSSLIL